MKEAGLWGKEQEETFPVIIKKGYNDFGKKIIYYFNFSENPVTLIYHGKAGVELFSKENLKEGDTIEIGRWDLKIIERQD